MTKEEVAKLVEMVASRLASADKGTWLPTPTRPEPPGDPTPGSLPAWSGAAQSLSDIAPARRGAGSPKHRPEYGAMVAATRQAAAGKGASPLPSGSGSGADRAATQKTRKEIPIGVSKRHVHVSQRDFEALFGKGKSPSVQRVISQPGQFAAGETVSAVGPKGKLEGVRIVGPARGSTQLELSPSDCRQIGIDAPVSVSGKLERSAGGVTLEGPAGKVALQNGVIVAQRHLHVAPNDGRALGVADGDRMAIECGPAGRRVTLHDVVVRLGPAHATELHLDLDEADAAGVKTGDAAIIVGRSDAPALGKKRPLVTERDVAAMAARGEKVSARGPYLLTPAARDRAQAMGIWIDQG
ncbi:MAG TPA: PduL/EutD family phosphate acyltransferase [Gemmatimonadales bacterium]|jgi:putative phosphotransacetylase